MINEKKLQEIKNLILDLEEIIQEHIDDSTELNLTPMHILETAISLHKEYIETNEE